MESASLGPRYAPDDPTLPKPWLGLIDGTTNLLYYWNPDTNVTQYERPAPAPPPLPSGPPPGPNTLLVPQSNALLPQQMHQISQHQALNQGHHQHQMHPLPHHQEQQFTVHHPQQMPHQQVPHQQYSHQQGPQHPTQQGQNTGFPHSKVNDFQHGKQIPVSPSHIQQSQASSLHNMPHGNPSFQVPQMGVQSLPPQQYPSSFINVPQTGFSSAQLPQTGNDSIHKQQDSGRIQKQAGPMVHHHPSVVTSLGMEMGSEKDVHGQTGNDFYFNVNKQKPAMGPQQSKLLADLMDLKQQEMRMGGVPPHNIPPHSGGVNMVAGPAMPNTYNHVGGVQEYASNNLSTLPQTRMLALSDVNVTNLSPADAYRRQHEITATGVNIPDPFMTFEATGFPSEILREMQIAGFSSPTPIQAQTWPIALQSRDIVAIAKTGSGKTLGYLMPAFIHLRRCRNNPQNGPTVLVLAPTRELATQIQDEAIKFGRSSRVSCTCLYGGAPKGIQIKELERGADIVVATPGRLNDILEMKKIDFHQVSLLVLDEADRMLDMGFEPQIRKIVNEIPPRRQTLMYTATWPKEVRKIAGDLLVHPVQVDIGNVDELAANKSITQHVEVVPQMQKQRRLEQILRSQERGSKIIVFCSTKRLCDQLTRSIGRSFGAAAIHGDKSQGERDYVLNQFRSGKSPILVATDVAARGLDIKDIRVVINYDFPTGIEDYVHRIGRTGRAGATGISYTFFSEQDWKYAADLVKLLEGANQQVPPEVRDMVMRGGSSFVRGWGGMNRVDSGTGRWENGDRGGERDGGFGGRGGGDRNGGFRVRGSDRNGGFGSRGGDKDGGFGVRGGERFGGRGRERFGGRGRERDGVFGRGFERDSGFGRGFERDSGFGGRGGRNDFFGGRENRGRGFSGPGGSSPIGWGRHDRSEHDRYNDIYRRGRDDRRGTASRSRGRSYSRSPERVRTWGYSRSSRSRSRSWSRSRSRSYSRSCGRSHSRSRSRSIDRFGDSNRWNSDQAPTRTELGIPLRSKMSPMSPAARGGPSLGAEPLAQLQPQAKEGTGPVIVTGSESSSHLVVGQN